MTLEDFFTLTEMKDGLAVPARVKDLVNVMHKEKDSIVKGIGDMTRQWSTVASTIIATEDKDCLELFIQLDGLCFIDRWLNDAQRFSVDANENFVEESITVLLRALEKLQVGYERSSSSGILLTVKNLLNHGSSRVQDGAKALFDQWNKNGDVDDTSKEVQNGGASGEDVILERSGADNSLPEDEEKCDQLDTKMPVISANDVEKERTDNKEVKEADDKHFDITAVENSSKEESVVLVADSVEKENDSFTPMVIDEVIEERSNVPLSNDGADDNKQEMPMRSVVNELGATEIVSTGQLQAKVGSAEEDDLTDAGMDKVLPMEIDSEKDDYKAPDNGNATFPTQDNGEVDEQEEGDDSSEENKELTINLSLLKPAIICKVPNSIDDKRSDIELDYSIVDALEVARQVAIEAKREVEDHRELSCSSSSEKKKNKSIDCSSMKDEEASSSSSSSSSSSRGTPDPETENSLQLTVSSQENDLDKELEANSGKGLIGLDLNMEICSEDVDQPEKPIPTHISQVSASRAAAVSELASSPLQQQPEDGWKGSATTSAFRKVLDGAVDKTPPPAEMNRHFLDFDLNVADDEDEEQDEEKNTTNSRPMLDLNIISDDSDSIPDHHHNHSSFKNIDLNLNEDEEPYSDPHLHHLLQPIPFNQSISIMGTKVEVGKRETVIIQPQPPRDHHQHVTLPRIGGDGYFAFGPTTLQYGQMAYNGGHAVGPSSSPFSLPPYMGGAGGGGPPVVPQSQFFMMSPAGGHYGAGSSSSSSNHHGIFDLNMNLNMGTTTTPSNGGFRQFLSMGGSGSGGGQNSLQPSSSSSSGYGLGKRKEAEGGWEYPYNNNIKRQQQQPPWK